ncbi:hypothetical protein NBRC116593_42570 [Sulfitobacter pacificus]
MLWDENLSEQVRRVGGGPTYHRPHTLMHQTVRKKVKASFFGFGFHEEPERETVRQIEGRSTHTNEG